MYHGNVSYYLEKKAEEEAAAAKAAAPVSTASSASVGGGKALSVNRKEQRRREGQKRQERATKLKPLQAKLEEVEGRITQLETSKAELMAKMSDPSFFTDKDRAKEIAQAFKAAESDIENAYTEWAEVSDEMERIEAHFAEA